VGQPSAHAASPRLRQPKEQYVAEPRPACPVPVSGPPQCAQVDMIASYFFGGVASLPVSECVSGSFSNSS
jgi:hypothetical protein